MSISTKERIGELIDKVQKIQGEVNEEYKIINIAERKINQRLNELKEIQCDLIIMRSRIDDSSKGQTR